MKRWIFWVLVCTGIGLLIWMFPPGKWLVPDCQMDGEFADWRGRACVDDSGEDGRIGHDFKKLSWATNENDSRIYFMMERYMPKPTNMKMDCRLFFDINGNGSYRNEIDKYAQITYQPYSQGWGDVSVYLYSVSGELQGKYTGKWGAGSKADMSSLEFAIPMEDLQAYTGQPMRFYLSDVSSNFDRLPNHGDIQWAPFPIVAKSRSSIAIVCLIWLVVTVFFYRHKLWVFYYIWGSVGLSCVLILLFHASFIEYRLESFTSLVLHDILGLWNIVTYLFDRSPGTLLVLIKIDSSWTTIAIDIENSGLIEMCVIFALIIFYPVYNMRKRMIAALTGVVGIYIINLIRLIVVITLINTGGRNMSFIAQTLFGRLVFFILSIALYWQLITRPSLSKVQRSIKND